jgi:hypothetical protein
MNPMKTIILLFFATFSISAFSQIQQNVNKTTGTVSKPITQIDSIRFNTNTNQMEIIQINGNAENHVISDITNVTFSGQLVGTIATIGCGTATNNGFLTAYSAASSVSSNIPYTGGNGGPHNGQTVNSTGVTGLTATLTAGTFAVGAGNLTYTITGTPNSSGTANFSINIGGKSCILQRTVILPIGTISSLNCGNATNNGTLYDGTAASGVSSSISYSGGNGGSHNGQVVASTGVTGLTATKTPGNFAVGSGSLNYTISGTPNTSGIASFLLDIGGQTCELTINVNLPIGIISLLDCGNATNTGSLTAYYYNLNGISSSIPYSGGNGGTYSLQSIPSTGVTGLTATIVADTFALGSGNLIYTISGTPNAGGNASFDLNIGGQSCTLTLTVNLPIGFILNLACGNATNTGSLRAEAAANGVSSTISYTDGNGGTHNGQIVASIGDVTGLTATLSPGIFAVGNGDLTYTITGTPNSVGTAYFALEIGDQTCYLTRTVSLRVGTITTLSCGNATATGTLTAESAANGVSINVPYSGGNGGTYSVQSVSSTGVNGLTANLSAGTLSIGSGNLIYTITGTPTTSGMASFAIIVGDENCVLTINVNSLASQYEPNSVFCSSGPTVIVDVTNPSTGKTWMDRNLGASQVATSSTDTAAYGDLYQWGRRADGHQCRTSAKTTALSSIDQPANGNFIISNSSGMMYDWRNPQNFNLWQGVNGVNSPCPTGYRLPTEGELDAERLSWSQNNNVGAFASPLKLPMAGGRAYGNGGLDLVGTLGYYWSSSRNDWRSIYLWFSSNFNSGFMGSQYRAYGGSVRCLKN